HSIIKSSEAIGVFSMNDWVDSHHIIENQKVRDHRHSNSKPFPLKYNVDDFAELVGWYISEGSINTNFTKGGKQSSANTETGQIIIAQNLKKNPENHQRIRNLLTRMDIPYGWDARCVYFTSRLFRNYFKQEIGIGSNRKKIP